MQTKHQRKDYRIMKMSFSKTEMSEALNNISRAVPQRATIPALEGVKLCLINGKLEITGYDLEIGIQTVIDAESDDYGEYVFNSRLFSDIIRKMPTDTVTVEINTNLTARIFGGNAEYNIMAMSADEYPSIPEANQERKITIPQPLLKNMINQTIFAVAVSESKPILTGELFEIEDGSFNLVAIDGYKLAIRNEMLKTDQNYNFVIKARSLSEIAKLLGDDDSEMTEIFVSKKHINFKISNYTVISRLLEGEFHNYRGAMPKEYETDVIIDTKPFIDCLDRCTLLLNDKVKAPVRCAFSDGEVKISCTSTIGKLSDEMDAEINGPEVEIGFNCRYLLDALRAAESDKVRLSLSGSASPMRIMPIDGDSFTFLVLPVRLR